MGDSTEEGKRRYPPDGVYRDCGEPVAICTCGASCPDPCRGECGCEACKAAYFDSIEYDEV